MATENRAGVQIERADPATVITPASTSGAASPVARPYPMRPLRTLMAPDTGALLKPAKDAIFHATQQERQKLLANGLAEDAGRPVKAAADEEVKVASATEESELPTKAKGHGKGGAK